MLTGTLFKSGMKRSLPRSNSPASRSSCPQGISAKDETGQSFGLCYSYAAMTEGTLGPFRTTDGMAYRAGKYRTSLERGTCNDPAHSNFPSAVGRYKGSFQVRPFSSLFSSDSRDGSSLPGGKGPFYFG